MATRSHFRGLSSSLGQFGAAMKSIAEENEQTDDENKDNKCPTTDQVLQILKENDFKNANEIAKEYEKYVAEEEYEKETLMEDLRDPDGSWLADSELRSIFEWSDEQTTKFKQLVLKLMVEKAKEVRMKSKHQAVFKSMLKKTQSKAFFNAFKKTAEKVKKESDHQSSMPTYINRAIWFRSDDENLERLVDNAVKEVLNMDDIWLDVNFVENIYKNSGFNSCIEVIFKRKFKFFERFVTERYKRQLQLHALFDEQKDENNKEDDELKQNKKEAKQNKYNYIVYYKIKEIKQDDDELKIYDEEEKKSDIDSGGDDNLYEYHIFPKSMKIDDKNGEYHQICELYVDKKKYKGFEWSWWKRKTKGDLLRKAHQNAINSYGFWEILNNEKINKQNVEKNGVGIEHLNIIFELLRHYYTRSLKSNYVADRINEVGSTKSAKTMNMELQQITSRDPTLLSVVYCQGEFIPVKFEVDIYIHEKDVEEKIEYKEEAGVGAELLSTGTNKCLYELRWWNGKKKSDCNAIAIKNKTVIIEDKTIDVTVIKEKYYMRFSTIDIDKGGHKNGIEWHWYDNDAAQYQKFKDYKNILRDNQYKLNLLHKQLDAIFLSNIDTNYPWILFDMYDAKMSKNNHSFNNAQITHLRPALEDHKLYFNTIGYMSRFVRLYASNDVESEFDLNIILNMEQVAITTEGTSFSRNIRRMKDGKNSLSFYYAGSNVFINHWLQNYLLSTKAQRLYFWSFILCIAAKIKQIDIEVENQLVTIPQYKAFISAKKSDTLTFDEGEVRDEQNDALLYEGFLVPPILDGEVATDQADGALSKTTVQGLKKKVNNLSKTRILRKAKVKTQQLKIVDDTAHEDDRFVWYQSLDGEQYRDSLGVMFRFAEIIRKFILETKHLGEDTSLWPYYKNYFHRNNHESYHRLINRFNLSLMFNRTDMFELLEQESIIESDIGCCSHFSCKRYEEDDIKLQESQRMKSKEVAIRHQRKFAAQLLLQKWDSLRNLNILRHQLGPLLDNLLTKHGNDYDEKKNDVIDNEKLQIELIEAAKKYDINKWKEMIQITNNRLQKNLDNPESGWQLLTDYDIHRVDSIEITTKKYPFFESFMKHFVLNDVLSEKENNELESENKTVENMWYPSFKQSWRITPEWWSDSHDIVLMELALKYGDKWYAYGQELTGEKASDYMMRLRSNDDDNEYGTYIPGHSIHLSHKDMLNDIHGVNDGDMINDELRPYLEFQHWCKQKSNMLHRLKYITNKLILKLNKIKPSLIEIRIPEAKDRPKFTSESLIFNEYERDKHKQYVEREMKLASVENYTTEYTLRAMKTSRGKTAINNNKNNNNNSPRKSKRRRHQKWHENASVISMDLAKNYDAYKKTSERKIKFNIEPKTENEIINQMETMISHSTQNSTQTTSPNTLRSENIPNYDKMKSVALSRVRADESESESSDGYGIDETFIEENISDEDATEIRIHDPFIHRNLNDELSEVIHAFNMIKYGKYMAKFIINEIREYNMEELWDALSVVMEAIPFPMGLEILHDQMAHLRRSKPEKLFTVCREMVEGTNFGVAAALRMADYFDKIAKSDNFESNIWKEKSISFEHMAHEEINDIESDHLLYILLTLPLYDTSESMSILSLALEQKRVSFLNNDRILGIMKHVWYHSAAILVEDEIDPRGLNWSESLQILVFQPFKFYMSPMGFNWTIAALYLLYLIFVVTYSYVIIKGEDKFYIDIIFWLFNAGFVLYEVSEFSDKGRQYFSVTGIMNAWDIMISIVWICLFVIYIFGRAQQLQHHLSTLVDIIDDDNGLNTHTTTTTTTTTIAPINGTTTHVPSTTFYVSTTEMFTSMFDDENEDPIGFGHSFREIYSFLWAIQLFLLSTRFLTLFQNTSYLGSLLKIVQKMFTEIIKFLSVAFVVIAAYTFGFYFIFGFNRVNIIGEEGDDAQDFWPTVLFTFDEFIGGGTSEYHENTVVPIFAMVITIIGFLILTNLLIALMSTEYENFQEIANLEVAYMWTETAYDLSHRDRLMPPPLNLIVYVIGIIIHICVWPLAICCTTNKCNLYTHFNHNTYVWLNTRYCGCNKAVRKRINDEIETNKLDGHGKDMTKNKNKKIFDKQSKKIYADRFNTFLSFSGWMLFRDYIINGCIKKCFCGCKCIDKCCTLEHYKKNKKNKNKKVPKGCCYGVKKNFRKCCCDDDDGVESSALTAYHKGCYNCIKLRVKDSVTEQDTITIRGISMKQYIQRYEDKNRTKLHKEDKILLKHLTVETLFCDKCYQPYLEKDIDDVLLEPFRVLLDIISCFIFVFTSWLPLIAFFSVMSIIEYCKHRTDQTIHSKTDTTGTNEYDEFDREYFPHPLRQVIHDK